MYGIFSYIYHQIQPNVGEYTNPMDPMGEGNSFELSKFMEVWLEDDFPVQFG